MCYNIIVRKRSNIKHQTLNGGKENDKDKGNYHNHIR